MYRKTRKNDRRAAALDRGVGAIEKSLARVVKKERMTQEDADAAMARISKSTSLGELTDRELVVEAVDPQMQPGMTFTERGLKPTNGFGKDATFSTPISIYQKGEEKD